MYTILSYLVLCTLSCRILSYVHYLARPPAPKLRKNCLPVILRIFLTVPISQEERRRSMSAESAESGRSQDFTSGYEAYERREEGRRDLASEYLQVGTTGSNYRL